MLRFFLALVFCFAILISVAIGTAVGIQWSGFADGVAVSIDGDTVQASMVVAALSVVAALAVALVCLIVVAALASVAVIVPIAIVMAMLAVAGAMLVGLSPILIPVLLVVGVCALLSRRAKRDARAAAGMSVSAHPMSPTVS